MVDCDWRMPNRYLSRYLDEQLYLFVTNVDFRFIASLDQRTFTFFSATALSLRDVTIDSIFFLQRLSAISVNVPSIMEQAIEIEKSKKKGIKEPRMRYKKSLLHPSDYSRRHSDTFVIASNSNSPHGLSKLAVLTVGTSSLSIPDMTLNREKF